MEIDQYHERLVLNYGLKLIDLFRRSPNSTVLSFLLQVIPSEEIEKLHRSLEREVIRRLEKLPNEALAKIKKQLVSIYEDDLLPGYTDSYAGDLFGKVLRVQKVFYSWYLRQLSTIIHKRLLELSKKNRLQKEPSYLEQSVAELASLFSLNNHETEIVKFFYLKEIDDRVSLVFSHHELKMDAVRKSIRNYCKFFNLLPLELKDILRKDAPLVRSGILERNHRDDDIEIASHVISFLSGLSGTDLSSQFFEKLPLQTQLRPNDFQVPSDNLAVMTSLLMSKNGVNILLHGSPGTGKTEFAKAVTKSVGMEAMFVKQTDEDGDESLSHRKTALVAAQNVLRERACVLIVDECDPIINTNGGLFICDNGEKKDEKSWINHYTERSDLKIIWISNRVDGIDPSTKRRFSYSQEFRSPGVKQRIKAWDVQRNLNGVTFLDNSAIDHMARLYSVSPGTISLAIRDVLSAKPEADPSEQTAMLKNILGQQQEFCVGKKSTLAPINQNYDLSGLNLDVAPERIIKSIRKFLGREHTLNIKNVNILLVGPPGTGKTELVKYVAEQVERELLVKRTSDIISPYVGVSEQNIAEVFSDAEKTGAILFLDEADSLFINREGANRSWEISQTNELLCQMENFSGILMCATNFYKSMDLAVMRRFTFKVGFDYLVADGNELFFKRILGPIVDGQMDQESRYRLRSLNNLSPGDFKVVYQKFAFDGPVPADKLISALEGEIKFGHRGHRPMGLGQH